MNEQTASQLLLLLWVISSQFKVWRRVREGQVVDWLSPGHMLRPQLQGRLGKTLFSIMTFILASFLTRAGIRISYPSYLSQFFTLPIFCKAFIELSLQHRFNYDKINYIFSRFKTTQSPLPSSPIG